MGRIAQIPSDYYLPAKALVEYGFTYSGLKAMAYAGGILERYKSKKTRRVFYRSKNRQLFH